MLTRDEMLEIIAEEGAEITKAAIKCLRFGFNSHHPEVGYGHNATELAKEVGDVLGMADALGLDPDVIATFRALKIGKAERAKERYGRRDREPMPTWRDIETTPKDGTEVLVSGFSFGEGPERYRAVGLFDGEREAWLAERDAGPVLHSPTHWMPLPEPPAK